MAIDKTHSMPVEEKQIDYEADDYLDELGTAALEQYELTQRPPLVADLHRPSSSAQTNWLDPIVGSGQSETSAVPHESKWKGKGGKQTSGELAGEVKSLREELSKEVSKVRELEEKGYEKDGEVKLLRGELRKKDDQLRELHANLLAQQKEKDDLFTRETKSLSTQLEFKDQELAALRERCSTLEQRNKQQLSASHTSPIPHSRPPQRCAPGEGATRSSQKDSVFLSTETFMPLSQMSSSDVTPVHVSRAPKTGPHASDGKGVSPETSDVKHKTPVGTASQSPSLVTARGKSVKEQHRIMDQSAAVPGLSSTSRPQKASQPSAPSSESKPASSVETDEQPIFLPVPPLEVSSRDLLMLLTHRDLLETPSFDDSEDESTVDHFHSQNSLQSTASGLPGLFSLLHIPHMSSSSSSLLFSACGMTTPISSSKFNPMTPPSAGPNLSVPSLELSTDSLPQTPIRKTKLQLHKSHTCGRTDMMRSRTRAALDDFPLRKTMSASNTPTHSNTITADDTDETPVSHTLLKSIDVGSLQGSILSLLREEDSSTASSFLNQSGRSHSVSQFSSSSALLHSAIQDSFTSRGDTSQGDVSVEIRLLLDLGDIVCRYVTEQTEKARASTMSTSNTSFSDLDSLDTQSPRSSAGSSSASSRSNSDLNQPSRADQSVVYQSLSILDTLLTYSRQAREQLTAPPPPEFLLEDEIVTALESKLGKAQRMGHKARGEEERMEEEGETEDSEGLGEMSGTFKPQVHL